jgi:hypothetical protein
VMLARFMMSKTFIGFSRSAARIFSRSVIAVPRFGDGDVAQQICKFASSENNSPRETSSIPGAPPYS